MTRKQIVFATGSRWSYRPSDINQLAKSSRLFQHVDRIKGYEAKALRGRSSDRQSSPRSI